MPRRKIIAPTKMPVEVSDIAPTPALRESEVAEEAAPDEEGEKEGAPEASAVDVSPAPAPKKRGRTPGSRYGLCGVGNANASAVDVSPAPDTPMPMPVPYTPTPAPYTPTPAP